VESKGVEEKCHCAGFVKEGRFNRDAQLLLFVKSLVLYDRFYGSRVGIRGSEISGGAH
jgi:hypothetical protein